MDNIEIAKLLRENLEISRKTLKIVQKMQRAVFWQRVLKMTKWGIIIGLIVFGFIKIQPYLESIFELYQSLGNTLSRIQELPSSQNLPEGLKNILSR